MNRIRPNHGFLTPKDLIGKIARIQIVTPVSREYDLEGEVLGVIYEDIPAIEGPVTRIED